MAAAEGVDPLVLGRQLAVAVAAGAGGDVRRLAEALRGAAPPPDAAPPKRRKQQGGGVSKRDRAAAWAWVLCEDGATWEEALQGWGGEGDAVAWLPAAATPPMIAAAAGRAEVLAGILADAAHPLHSTLAMQEVVTGATVAHVAAANTAADPAGRCMAALCAAAPLPEALTCAGKGVLPVHTAALHCHAAAVRVLVETLGRDAAGAPAKGGWTPAHFACGAEGDATDVVAYLASMERGSINTPDKQGRTPAHIAARRGNVKSLQVLLRSIGGDAALVVDSQGATIVHAAAYGGHTEAVRAAVACCGVRCLAVRDNDGRLALDSARRRGHEGTVEWMLAAAPGLADAAAPPPGDTAPLGKYRVSNVEAKRWQRAAFLKAAAESVQAAVSSPSAAAAPPVVLLLDDASLPDEPGQEGGRSCAGDILRLGVAPPPVTLVIPNPCAAARAAIAADCGSAPNVDLRASLSGPVVAALAGTASVAAVWLDYCDSLDHGTNRDDVRALFTAGVLRRDTPSTVALTFSWRGAADAKHGPPKDGRAYLAAFRRRLTAFVAACATDGGAAVEEVTPFTQQGQLFFGVFRCRPLGIAVG